MTVMIKEFEFPLKDNEKPKKWILNRIVVLYGLFFKRSSGCFVKNSL